MGINLIKFVIEEVLFVIFNYYILGWFLFIIVIILIFLFFIILVDFVMYVLVMLIEDGNLNLKN